jgi:hypothetical protein
MMQQLSVGMANQESVLQHGVQLAAPACDPCHMQIVVGRAHTVDGQMDLLMTVGAKMVEEPYKLLIVDSIMALFRCATRHGEVLGYLGHLSAQNWACIMPVFIMPLCWCGTVSMRLH